MTEKESKKRKRERDGEPVPNRKVAVGNGTVKVTFDAADGLAPVLVSTPGLTAPDVTFKAYTKPFSKTRTGTAASGTHDLLLHSQQHPRLDYTATSASLDQGLAHYVAVYDPSTQQLSITPAHHLSLRASPRTKAISPDKQRLNMSQQRAELGREFGTKKAKKIIADRTVNAIVNRDPKGKGQISDLETAILQSMPETPITATSEEQAIESVLASKPIPRPNLDAEDVEDVYSFSMLVPQADQRSLDVSDWQEKAESGEEALSPFYTVATRINTAAQADDPRRLLALKYLSLLLEFHACLPTAGRGARKVPPKEKLSQRLGGWPENLVSSVRRRFANEANELPKWHMQKLYTYMCALLLFVDGWTTDTTLLRDDLRLETKDMVSYFRELGCAVSAPSDAERVRFKIKKSMPNKVAKLKLPLDFPKARGARRR